MNTVRLFSEDIGMQFRVDKCAITVLKRGKLDSSNNGIIFENQDTIRSLDEKTATSIWAYYLDKIRKTAYKDYEIKFRRPGDGN